MAGVSSTPTSIFELALRRPSLRGADAHLLATLFDIRSGQAPCRLSSKLSAKYGAIVELNGDDAHGNAADMLEMLRDHALW